jgi:hypothetical protein
MASLFFAARRSAFVRGARFDGLGGCGDGDCKRASSAAAEARFLARR